MLLHDTLDASSTARICADGSLVADVRAARVGIQEYRAAELGLTDRAGHEIVRVYRPEAEVFHRDSLASFAAAPVTIDHPSQPVTAENWRALGVGEIHGDVVRDGGFVRVPIIVRDAAAVAKVQRTHRQLSMGYTCVIDATPGTTPGGEAFDAVQRDIRVNHIAAVPAARGGPELKISDERLPPEPEKPPMKIRIGDAEVDATNGEAVRIAVDALNTKLAAAVADAKAAGEALATETGKVAALEKQLADATAAHSPEAIDRMVADRAALVTRARSVAAAIVTDGKTDAEIRREVVAGALGDAAKDMDDAGIAGAFAVLTKDAKPADAQVRSITAPLPVSDAASVADKAWAKSIDNLNAWRAN